jgi:hypothetical protein
LHTKITHLQLVIWIAVIVGQLAVGLWSYRRRNAVLVVYLGVEVVRAVCVFTVAHLASAHAYYIAYWIGWFVDYAAQVYLVVAIFQTIQKTGIPSRYPMLLHVFAGCMFALAILTLRFPLLSNIDPGWKWMLTIDHVALYWLCLMLAVVPFYAWMVDSAKDTRLLLIYLGFALYVAVRSNAVDTAIGTHLAVRPTHITEIAYLVSLVLWIISSNYQVASHQWDPAQTEALKTALRAKHRSNLHELSALERSRTHEFHLFRSSNSPGRSPHRQHGSSKLKRQKR